MGTGCSSSHVIHTITHSTTFCFSTSNAAWTSSSAAGATVQRLPWGRTGRKAPRQQGNAVRLAAVLHLLYTWRLLFYLPWRWDTAHTHARSHSQNVLRVKNPMCFRNNNPCIQWRDVHFLLHPQRAQGKQMWQKKWHWEHKTKWTNQQLSQKQASFLRITTVTASQRGPAAGQNVRYYISAPSVHVKQWESSHGGVNCQLDE